MTQKDAILIFNSVKTDDLASFCMHLNKNPKLLNISFGRYPLLSACYLYNSKRIIKKIQQKTSEIDNFEIVYEPFELYKDFRVKSNKSLRYYAGTNDFVMPIEMKAILGCDHFVKKNFKSFATLDQTEQKLKNIYYSKGQKCEINGKNIKISAKKLTKKRIKGLVLSSSATFGVLAIVAIFLTIVATTIGLGTSFSPRKVYAATELVTMLNKNKSVILQDDLIFDDEVYIENYSGTIYGNNKTITINFDYNNCLFDNFDGIVKDLTIINTDEQIETEKNLSLFANVNNGKIDNTKISLLSTIKIESTNDESFFCGYAITNNNYISNCKINFDIDISSSNNLDCFASGIAGKNYGTISACEVVDGSKITAKNVDICGIASQNFENAEISTSKNYATLFQTTDMTSWSPNVAGICITNVGTISNCYNYGNLSVEKLVDTSNNSVIFAGGICAVNNATINHSKNVSSISINDKSSEIYAGGICAYAFAKMQNTIARVEYCGSESNFDITKEKDETFCLCGGIAGYMVGIISNSYSMCEFENQYNKEKNYLVSLLVGSSYGEAFFELKISIGFEKTYCLSNDKTTKMVAIAFTNNGNFYIDNLTKADITICNSESQIKTSEVYWAE